MGSSLFRRSLPLAVLLGLSCSTVELAVSLASAPAVASTTVALKVRQVADRVDLVVSGLGANPRVRSQSLSSSRWTARLTGASPLDLPVPQEVGMPELGLKSIRLSQNSDSDFALAVEASRELSLAQPQISANGKELIVSFSGLAVTAQASTSAQLDLRRPGRVAQPSYVPPLRSRATAPPVGDIAVGTMLVSPNNFINISGPPVTLVLNNASAKDALMSLARIGGFSFIYVGSEGSAQEENEANSSVPVTLAFKNESYGRALNSILLSSGLQAKLEGNTLLVGENLTKSSFAPQMSKVFRLNQVKADKASNYLANLGSCMSTTNTITTTTGAPAAIGTSELSTETSQTTSEEFKVEQYCADEGPLRGLVGTTDERLGTVTLVGEPRLIAFAESYLKQIDLRRRQVAVKVQILNVDLLNDKGIDSSFSARMGDKFIVSESGQGFLNFGSYKPSGTEGTGTFNGEGYLKPGTYSAPLSTADISPLSTADGSSYRQPSSSFYSYLEAQIQATSAKAIAQPTLLVQEGQKARVETGIKVITNVKETQSLTGGASNFTYEKELAGVEMGVSVDKIDDNGFVTLSLNPEVSVPSPAGSQRGIQIFNINKRLLDSGSIRLRDGQTLVLTGVIDESQREQVTKWPILGDLPLLGSLFRSSTSSRSKNELVILVTPRILDDNQGGIYGYGYRPATSQGTRFLRDAS